MMMHDTDIRTAIANSLAASIGNDWPASAAALLHTLGYRSERLLAEQSGDAGDFIRQLPAPSPGAASERTFLANAQSLHILLQITDAEISAAMLPRPPDAAGFDTGNIRSFMFVAVELRGNAYARGEYALFTREINKRWQIPTVVLFRTAANLVTLAFVHRRPHRRDPERDVLGSVFLIREINPANPHRADLDSLADLSLRKRLDWLEIYHRPRNFDGLLAAWLKALDTEELNRKFYRELFQWFERAVDVARFPDGQARTLEPEWHVIRLITRLMFVWFIKEKGLVAEELFVESQVSRLLKNYDRANGDSYYRAVLQNLFFATLNTPLADRDFSAGGNSAHRVFSLYRYRREMADPDGLTALFGKTPFINGGLFDCLDSVAATRDGGYRIDCFSDNPAHRQLLSIPNRLFFNDPHDNDPHDNGADDNDPDDAGADAGIGLIDLFNRYQFTVEENTPAEQEVALDPELLGKVFENLLAAVNPETRENARKQTGSYYTPRAVVDYMVDEALTATLSQKAFPDDDDYTLWPDRLRYLLDYDDAPADANTPFSLDERQAIVRAIAQTRVLDPAVGSGAFPMGILHKLTLALRRLDPDNSIWASIQREQARARADAAFDTDDRAARDAELDEISDIFECYRDSDFGRKLYLIQNSIYGVDIQSIATQIAKLRFFISLAIEQKASNDAADNYGIKPLPNLETRFVAADTLLPLDKPAQMALGQTDAVERLRRELAANREQYFHATTRDAKKRRRDADQDLRQQLADALQDDGFPAGSARQIIAWEPFDQSANPAEWFDAEYMFGVTDGFDVVIGNPPYIQLQKDRSRLAGRYENAGYRTFARTGDIYQLFYERGMNLLAPGAGLLSYITSNSWLKAEYGKSTRRYFADNHTPLRLLEMGKDVFEQAIVDASIVIARHGKSNTPGRGVDMDRLPNQNFPPDDSLWGELRPQGERPWNLLSPVERSVMDKMEAVGTPLKDWNMTIYRGVTTGLNAAFVIDDDTRQELIDADPKSAEIIKPVLRGRDIQRYRARRARRARKYLIYARKGVDINRYPAVLEHLSAYRDALSKKAGTNEWYELQASPSDSADSIFNGEKLIWMDLTHRGRFAYDGGETFCLNTAFMMSGGSIKYLCGILNSRLITWFMSNTALNSGMGVTRWIRHTVEQIPIPRIPSGQRRRLERLVERILRAKAVTPTADTAALEEEIDWLVYDLYGLSNEETAVVEDLFWKGTQSEAEEDQALLRAMAESDSNDRASLDELRQTLRARGRRRRRLSNAS